MYQTGYVPAVTAAEVCHSRNLGAFLAAVSQIIFGCAGRALAFCLRNFIIVVGKLDFLAHMADNLVHQENNRATIFFAQCYCTQSQVKAFGNTRRRNGNQPVVAVGAPTGLHNLALCGGGRLAGCGAYTLYVNDNAGDFGAAGEAEHFLFQGEAWAAGCGHSFFTGHRCTDNSAETGDFVFSLHKFTANLRQTQS